MQGNLGWQMEERNGRGWEPGRRRGSREEARPGERRPGPGGERRPGPGGEPGGSEDCKVVGEGARPACWDVTSRLERGRQARGRSPGPGVQG